MTEGELYVKFVKLFEWRVRANLESEPTPLLREFPVSEECTANQKAVLNKKIQEITRFAMAKAAY